MRLFLTASVVLTALISPLSQTETSAAFRYSNQTSKPIYVMHVRHDRSCAGIPWRKQGWWRLEPGQTVTADGSSITNRYSYFYAESSDGTLKWESDSPVACVTNRAFQACWNDCPSPTRKLGLRKIDAGSQTTYTVNLTSGSSPPPRPTPPTPTIKTVRVTVWRHSSVGLTSAEADRILADMGGILQGKDAVNDVPTSVRFIPNGPIRTLPGHVPAVIQSAAQFEALRRVGPGVKIVRAIRWCSGPGGSIIGCAPVGSREVNLAAVRFTPNQEGILWVHEYGHNVGLSHRQNDGNAIMFPSMAPNRKVVSLDESRKYLAGPEALTGHAAAQSEEPFKAPDDVAEFVLQHYFHGVPREAASRYKEKDARTLLKMLADPDAEISKYVRRFHPTSDTVADYLPEIVSTLCFIGGEEVVEPLIEFIKTPSNAQSVFNARNAALIHLGDLINRTQSKAALAFLKLIARPKKARPLIQSQLKAATIQATNAAVTAPVEADLTDELVGSAMLGLGLSGSDEAQAVLGTMTSGAAVDGEAVSATIKVMAADAAEICDCVKKEGLNNYYQRLESHQHDHGAGHDHGDGHDHGAAANFIRSENSIDIPGTVTPLASESEDPTESFVRDEPERTEAQLSDDAGDALRTSESLPEGASDSKPASGSDSGSSNEAAARPGNKSDSPKGKKGNGGAA